MKRITFSFSIPGDMLGQLLAAHADNMNIQVFEDAPKKTRTPRLNGHSPQLMLPAPNGRAGVDQATAAVLTTLQEANAPMRAPEIQAKVTALTGLKRNSVYKALKALRVAGQIAKDGQRYVLGTASTAAPSAPAKPRTKRGTFDQTGAEFIVYLLKNKRASTLTEMKAAFVTAHRSPKSISSQLYKLIKAKTIASDGQGNYRLI